MHVNKLHINMEKISFIHFILVILIKNAVAAEFNVKIGDEFVKHLVKQNFCE